MEKVHGANLAVMRNSLACFSTGYFFYSDNITALIVDEEVIKNEKMEI